MSLIIVLVLGLTVPAYAYLDPGSGSMLAQALAAGFAGIGVLIKFYWHRIRRFFGRGKPAQDEAPKDTPQAESGTTE